MSSADAPLGGEPARHAGVHLLFLNKLATVGLVNANLHLLIEPAAVGQQLVYSFLRQGIRAPAGGGQLVQLGFLFRGELHLHAAQRSRFAHPYQDAAHTVSRAMWSYQAGL